MRGEYATAIAWHRTSLYPPRSGMRVLGWWEAGDEFHIVEREYTSDRYFDHDTACELVPPDWWALVKPPKEEE